MIVKLNADHLVTIGIPGDDVNMNVPLIPGINVVDDRKWRECVKQASVKSKMAKGEIEELEGKTSETPKKGPGGKEIPLKDKKGQEALDKDGNVIVETQVKIESKPPWKVEAKKAVEMVKETYSIDELEKWLEQESRDEVRAALANQIDKMKK